MLNYQRVHPGDGFPAHSEVETTHVTMTVTEHLNVTQSSPFCPQICRRPFAVFALAAPADTQWLASLALK